MNCTNMSHAVRSNPGVQTTQEDASYERTLNSLSLPGAVVVYSVDRPVLRAYPLRDSGLRIGRDVGDITVDDSLLSREHAEFVHTGREWIVRDLGSRNGTFVNGARLAQAKGSKDQAILRGVGGAQVVRVGRTIVLLSDDVRPLLNSSVELTEDFVFGPRLKAVMMEIEDVGRASESLHINGPSGSGKELAARRFHASSPRANGPFVPVNCAAIPGGLAERLLFGAVKGAYSGADVDAKGYVQAAHGGTLFLDEIAELDLAVQAKLLRVLETREVIPLGATKAIPIDVLLCSATHRDLRDAVATKEFRSDLYFRVAQPEVRLPPLGERREEIPYLLDYELAKLETGLAAHPLLVEACMIRDWPGNVRELRREVAHAGRRAIAAGETAVPAHMLNRAAGTAFNQESKQPTRPNETVDSGLHQTRGLAKAPRRDEIVVILSREGWNISAAARTLGVHRTQLCRWMERLDIQRPTNEGR